MGTSRSDVQDVGDEASATLRLDGYEAAIFDLDGVITDTASVHRAAWKRLFDDHLASRPPAPGEDHLPFTEQDYLRHLDGRPREDGIRAFLESRGVEVDERVAADLGERKNGYFLESLGNAGLTVFRSTVEFVCRLQLRHIRTAVFSASRNCGPILDMAGLSELFAARVDGVVAGELGLPGKPHPAMLLEAAHRVEAEPHRTMVFEDAQAGVEAGRRGGFGLVVGIDRVGAADQLRARGADLVVEDLGELRVDVPDPQALEQLLARLPGGEQTPRRM